MQSFVTSASQLMTKISDGIFVLLSILVSGLKIIHECVGQVELKYGASRSIRLYPQPAIMGFDDGPESDSPMPVPLDFVV
jgi:hypothetical protein